MERTCPGKRGHKVALPCKGINFDVVHPIVFWVQLFKTMNYCVNGNNTCFIQEGIGISVLKLTYLVVSVLGKHTAVYWCTAFWLISFDSSLTVQCPEGKSTCCLDRDISFLFSNSNVMLPLNTKSKCFFICYSIAIFHC